MAARSPALNLRKRCGFGSPPRSCRANPVSWVCRSWIGDWSTDDRVTWTTADGVWLAKLERSANGRRVFLRIWRDQTYVGYQDDVCWHAPTSQRTRRSRPQQASLPLPLAG
jgi:hypothetical protein